MYRFGTSIRALPFFNTDGGAGAGAPDPAAGSNPNPGANPGAPAPSATGQPAAQPAAQPNAQPTGFTYKEDRSNWVPSHVVRQRTEELEKYKRDLEFERQRVAALSGVKAPAAPRNPEHEQIRSQLYEIAPELKELAELKEKLKGFADFDPSEFKTLKAAQEQAWTAQANQVLAQVVDRVKGVYGGAELSPKAVQRIQRSFIAEVSEDPELRARYENGDLSIIDEFVKDLTGSLLDPYRRSTAAANPNNPATRPRLPRGGGGSAVVGPRPSTVKPTDGESYHKAAFERFQQG